MRKRTKMILLAGVVALVCGGLAFLIQLRVRGGARETFSGLGYARRGEQAVPVRIMPVKQSDLEHRIAEVATVQPGRLYPVSAEVAGRVVSTHFELGQGVRKGQVLIVLDDAPVKLALAEAAQSKSLAELEVGHARQDLVRTRELAKLLTRERGDQLAQVAVDLQKAKDDLARSTALHRRKIASATELADAKARLQSLTAGHMLAATRLALEHTRQRLAVETAQHKLATAGVGLKVALNKLARTALERDRHRILAPADGVVVVKQSEVGQRTTVGGQLGQHTRRDPPLQQQVVLVGFREF